MTIFGKKWCILVKKMKIFDFLQGVSKKPEFGRFFMFFRPEIFFKNDPIRANFMRGIGCAHLRSRLFPKIPVLYYSNFNHFYNHQQEIQTK
jgi:hypothetical protein